MIHILNRFDEIIGFLSNENPETPVYWGGKHTEKLNSAANYYEFSTVTDHEYVQELTNMNKVVASHPDGYFIPFRIHRVTQRNKDGVREKVVEVEGEHMRLRTAKVLSPITLTSATLKTAARFILSGTGWQVGLVEFAGAKTIEFNDFTNALNALHHINELFGMEIRFRIVIQRNKVVGRYVDFLERIGEDNGKEIVLAKDLMSVERIEDSKDVYTALIGIGKANEEGKFITFEGINGGKNYVEDQEAFQRWGDESGHHIGVYYLQPEEGEELTPEIVRERTKEALKRHIDSVVQYKVTGASLEKVFDLDHEKVRKGDTVRIKNTGFTPPLYLKARVLETFRYDDPGKEDEFLLGNYHELKIKPNQLLLDLQKRLFRNERKWSSAVRKVRSALPPQDQTVIWIDTTEVPNIVKTYNESESAWEKASPTVAVEVGAETPEGAEAKANTAKSEAIAYMNTQLTNYVNATLYSEEISDLQAQIDNQIQSHFKPYEPSLSNEPASDWRTDEEKRNHVGDLFYNTETGHSYRFALDGTFTWLLVRDEGIAKALADAAQAQDTADSKRRMFVSPPNTPYDEGDLWDKDGAVFRSTVTKTKSASFSLSDWVKIGDVTSENKAKDTDSVGGVPAEDIETKDGASGKANQVKADAQTFTETYANKKVTQSTSPPDSPSSNDLWIDISVDPYVWKRWDGETWKKATPTTAEEVGAETPTGAQYKANQAKEDAVSISQQDAAQKAANAFNEAQTYTQEYANKRISQGVTPPDGAKADDLWIDTSTSPYVWKRYTGSSWMKATPTSASEVGAETPSGAQAKANAAKTAAETAAQSYTEQYANKKVAQGSTTPASPSTNDLWIDTGSNPYVWKRWTGSAWVKATSDSFGDLKGTISANQIASNTITTSMISTSGLDAGVVKTGVLDAGRVRIGNATTFDKSMDTVGNNLNEYKTLDTTETGKWRRIAVNTGNRAHGRFILKNTSSGKHATVTLEAGINYGNNPYINLLSYSHYSGVVFSKARIVRKSTYDTVWLEVFIPSQDTLGVEYWCTDNIQDSGWGEGGWEDGDTIPTGYSTLTKNLNEGETTTSKADNANSTVEGWKYSNTTYIDGGNIYTGTVTANEMKSRTITANEIKTGTLTTDLISTAGLDAGVIKTGVLDANRVKIGSGTKFDSGFDPTKKTNHETLNWGIDNVSDWLILLTSVGHGASNYMLGRLTGKRVSGNYNAAIIDVIVNFTSAGVPSVNMRSIGVQNPYDYSLVRCTYNGTDYIALRYNGSNAYAVWSTGAYFDGQRASQGSDALKVMATADATNVVDVPKSFTYGEQSYGDIAWEGGSSQEANDAKAKIDGWKYADTTYIDGGNIYTGTVTANKIKSRTISANEISSRTITANEIKVGTLSSDLIVAAGLDAGVIKFGTMSGSRISTNSLHGDRITAGTINANRLEAGSIIAGDITFSGELRGATGDFKGALTAYSLKVDTQSGGEVIFGTGHLNSSGNEWVSTGDVRLGNDYLSADDRVINLGSISGDVRLDIDVELRVESIRMMAGDKEIVGPAKIYSDTFVSTTFEIQEGDKNILLSDSNPVWHGNHMGATVDFYGDGTRNNALLYTAGIEVLQALGLVNGKLFGENDAYYRFGDDGSSYKHHVIEFGKAKLKSLNGSQSTIQARTLADDGYTKITASDFQVGSLRSCKKNIEPYRGDALHKVVGTQVYHYHLNNDDDRELKRVGLIYEESDADVVDPSGDGMSSYSMTAVLWKAVQELNSKVIDLQNSRA